LVGHKQESTAVTWSKQNPQLIVSCSDDNTVRVWSMNRDESLKRRKDTYEDRVDGMNNNSSSRWSNNYGSRGNSFKSIQTRKRRNEDGGTCGSNKRRQRDEHEASSWSSSQPGVQSSIFRYLERSPSPSNELSP
jgi:WD40 repeat protein